MVVIVSIAIREKYFFLYRSQPLAQLLRQMHNAVKSPFLLWI